MTEPHYTRDNLPAEGWKEFARTNTTRMVRVDGPFTVTTKEGDVRCEDGWLAVDSGGDPYPIDIAVHEASYREVTRALEDSRITEVRVRPDGKAIAYRIPDAALRPGQTPQWGCLVHRHESGLTYVVLTEPEVQGWVQVFWAECDTWPVVDQ